MRDIQKLLGASLFPGYSIMWASSLGSLPICLVFKSFLLCMGILVEGGVRLFTLPLYFQASFFPFLMAIIISLISYHMRCFKLCFGGQIWATMDHMRVPPGCFYAKKGELCSCDRDCLGHKIIWAFVEKVG